MRHNVSRTFLMTTTRGRRPAGPELAEVERPVPPSRPVEVAPPPAAVRESPLSTFSQSIAAAGVFTIPATGNFLRFNKSAAGTDAVQVRLKNGLGDNTHAAVNLFPGQRIRGRSFTHVEITVPAGLAGTAEFIYTSNPPADDVSDIL